MGSHSANQALGSFLSPRLAWLVSHLWSLRSHGKLVRTPIFKRKHGLTATPIPKENQFFRNAFGLMTRVLPIYLEADHLLSMDMGSPFLRPCSLFHRWHQKSRWEQVKKAEEELCYWPLSENYSGPGCAQQMVFIDAVCSNLRNRHVIGFTREDGGEGSAFPDGCPVTSWVSITRTRCGSF